MNFWNFLAGIPINATLRIKITELEEKIATLTKENAALKEENAKLKTEAQEYEIQIKRLTDRIARSEQARNALGPGGPQSWMG